MTESAALLVDAVFPEQPVRQWVRHQAAEDKPRKDAQHALSVRERAEDKRAEVLPDTARNGSRWPV